MIQRSSSSLGICLNFGLVTCSWRFYIKLYVLTLAYLNGRHILFPGWLSSTNKQADSWLTESSRCSWLTGAVNEQWKHWVQNVIFPLSWVCVGLLTDTFWPVFALIATSLVTCEILPTSLTLSFVFQDDIRINKNVGHKLIRLSCSSQSAVII